MLGQSTAIRNLVYKLHGTATFYCYDGENSPPFGKPAPNKQLSECQVCHTSLSICTYILLVNPSVLNTPCYFTNKCLTDMSWRDYLIYMPCIETRPTAQTVYLGEVPVNLSAISEATNTDIGYLSRIFAKKQTPSLKTARKVSAALNMTLEEFLASLEK